MSAMLCICNGLLRSGSTWSFNVCRALLEMFPQTIGQPVRSGALKAAQLDQFVADDWPGLTAHSVIKAHDLGPAVMGVLRGGSAKAVCTFRDPRDCVVSDMAFMARPFEVSLKRIAANFLPIQVYQNTPNLLLIRFENMMFDRRREIRRIADHLGLPIDDLVISEIDAKTNIQASRHLCQSLEERPARSVIRVANHIVDPLTLLHQNHINGATIGRWKFELPVEQALYLTEYFAPSLIRLGYETIESLNTLMRTARAEAKLHPSLSRTITTKPDSADSTYRVSAWKPDFQTLR